MSDAPERVWVYHLSNGDIDAQHGPRKGYVEHIRADIHEGEVMAWQHQYREAGGYANELRAENARLRERVRELEAQKRAAHQLREQAVNENSRLRVEVDGLLNAYNNADADAMRVRAENARLREALEEIRSRTDEVDSDYQSQS